MSKPVSTVASESGTAKIPTFEQLAADPQIAALLDFEPAPRKLLRPDGWTAELQRELIARIANCGTPAVAAEQMGKNSSGAKHVYRCEGGEAFREAWAGAMELFRSRERKRRAAAMPLPIDVPGMTRRRGREPVRELLPGQMINELGQPEDVESVNRRGAEAQVSIGGKLLACRRAYLCEIADNPGKRAAFEILTELRIDWDKAARNEPQDDEPWRRPNFRKPDMVLTAENGWLGSIVPYGPDKISELRDAVNAERKRRGLPEIVDWEQPDLSDEADEADPVRTASPHAGIEPTPPEPLPAGPPPSRTFALNSEEFYDAVAEPSQRYSMLPKVPIYRAPEPVVKTGPAPRLRAVPKGRKGKGR